MKTLGKQIVQGLLDTPKALAEVPLTLGSGLVGAALGPPVGLARSALGGESPEKESEKFQQNVQYHPTTPAAKLVTETVGKVMKPLEGLPPTFASEYSGMPPIMEEARKATPNIKAIEAQTVESARAPVVERANLMRRFGLRATPDELAAGKTGVPAKALQVVAAGAGGSRGDLSAKAAAINIPKVSDMIREDLGIKKGVPLVEGFNPDKWTFRSPIDNVIEDAAKVGEKVKRIKTNFTVPGELQATVGEIAGTYAQMAAKYPEIVGTRVDNIISGTMEGLSKRGSFAPADAINLLRSLRQDTVTFSKAAAIGNPDAMAMAAAARKASNWLEQVIEYNLDKPETKGLFKQYVDSRKTMARGYDALEALDPATGTIIPKIYAKKFYNRDPLSGNAFIVGDLAYAYPASFIGLREAEVLRSNARPYIIRSGFGGALGAGLGFLAAGPAGIGPGGFLGASAGALLKPTVEDLLLNPKLKWKGVGGPVTRPLSTVENLASFNPTGLPKLPEDTTILPVLHEPPAPSFREMGRMLGSTEDPSLSVAEKVANLDLPIPVSQALTKAAKRRIKAEKLRMPVAEPRETLQLAEHTNTPRKVESLRGDLPSDTVDFMLRQEVIQQPGISQAIDAFRKELAGLEKELKLPRNTKQQEIIQGKIDKLKEEFGAGMRLLGARNAAETHGLNRPLYESGGQTQLPIKKIFTLDEGLQK